MRARAIAWSRRRHDVVCDVIEPWEHGVAVRCSAHPGFWDYNCLRLEGPDPGLGAEELAAVADRMQEGLRHRRFDIEDEAAGARLRPGFEALGWHTTRLVWLALSDPPPGPDFEEVPFAVTRPLRLDWARSDILAVGEEEFQRQADAEEAVAAGRGVRALIARDDAGELAGYVTFLTDGETAEVEQAYVTPSLRGRGTGGALVAAAARVGGASETFIIADDEGDPKRLYQRLGFRPVWIQYELTRRPQ
ncbi:MAG TPA: GNAT family N-acetyltransferase [Solirubrobacteraceae bacterium]|nr:GNAT family N-acetyltransferase [Solirubrobacteraceae bacterium]